MLRMTLRGTALAALEQLRAELLAELSGLRVTQTWPECMSVQTAASYMDCSPERLRKLIARREIPFVQQCSGGPCLPPSP